MNRNIFKKVLTVLLCMFVVCAFFACKDKTDKPNVSGGDNEVAEYTVTFVDGESVVKTLKVESGSAVKTDDIPSLAQVTGYVLTWEEKDLSNITANVTVNSVKTPKKYMISFGVSDDVTVSVNLPASKEVTFAAEYTLPSFSVDGYAFNGWLRYGAPVSSSGVWNIDGENIKLIADLTKNEEEPQTFKIYFDLNGGGFDEEDLGNFTYDETEQKYYLSVTHGAPFALATPVKNLFTFVGWKISDGYLTDGTFTRLENVYAQAEWKSINDDGNWTPDY